MQRQVLGYHTVSTIQAWITLHSSSHSRDGDLTISNSDPLGPLHSFSLDTDAAPVIQLPKRLDLGVGGAGIIGRKVSVMTSSWNGPRVVGEGVIGWN